MDPEEILLQGVVFMAYHILVGSTLVHTRFNLEEARHDRHLPEVWERGLEA